MLQEDYPEDTEAHMKAMTFLSLSLFLLSGSCQRPDPQADSAHQTKPAVANWASHLDEGKRSSFGFDVSKLNEPVDLDAVYFSDQAHGWIGGGPNIYKTDNGGKNWERLKTDIESGAHVEDIMFVSPSSGWVVVEKNSNYVLDYPEYRAWLMHTDDGGRSWQVQYDEKQVEITRVIFSDEQNGWLTGIRYIGTKGVTYTHLVLQTSDQGHQWSDVSDNLVRLTSDERDTFGDPINDGIIGIIPEGPGSAHVVTGRMKVFKTTNGGKDWHQTAEIRDELDQQSAIRRFGMTGNHLWVASSADSQEGTRGVITVEDTDNSWARHELDGVYFADSVSLSKDEFVACGYIKTLEQEAAGYEARMHGVVLYSSDSGRNWLVVYRNDNLKSVNALAIVDANHIWAVGDRGFILRLERSRPEVRRAQSNGSAEARSKSESRP